MKNGLLAVRRIWNGEGNTGLVKLPRWVLEKAKCNIGDYVVVSVEAGSIILTPLHLTLHKASLAGPKPEARPPAEGGEGGQGRPTRADEAQPVVKKAAEEVVAGG